MSEETISRFLAGSFIYPPMDIFENPGMLPERLASSLLTKCERLAGGKREEFYSWLDKMSRISGLCLIFFGRSVYGGAEAGSQDVDLLQYVPDTGIAASSPGIPPRLVPGFIHAQTYYEMKHVRNPESWELFLSNRMIVYPQTAPDSLFERIQGARKMISERDFFSGGVGELITHAAYKALSRSEQEYFLPHEWEAVCGRSLAVDLHHCDMASMESRLVHPRELNERVRSRMKLMEDHEVDALTNAAMRRLAVRKSKRAELGGRFLRELRALQR